MNDPRIHTDVEHDDLAVVERNGHARARREPEQLERDRGLIIARVIHHIGGGIRWSYNRNLAWAFAISIGLHVTIIGIYAISLIGSNDAIMPRPRPRLASLDSLIVDTNFIAIDMRQVVVINPGGGGGDVTSDNPEGLAKAGDPNAQPRYVPEAPKNPNAKVFDPKTPTNIKTVREKKPDDRAVATTDRDTAKGASSGTGYKGQHAQGKGTTDAGGSGGTGIGSGSGAGKGSGSGLASRGWLRQPSNRPFENMIAEGKVTLRFTVLPNGEITNISPIKTAHPSLLKVAVQRLSAAKVRPLPAGSPPVSVSSQYTFNFKLPK